MPDIYFCLVKTSLTPSKFVVEAPAYISIICDYLSKPLYSTLFSIFLVYQYDLKYSNITFVIMVIGE